MLDEATQLWLDAATAPLSPYGIFIPGRAPRFRVRYAPRNDEINLAPENGMAACRNERIPVARSGYSPDQQTGIEH